MATRPRRHEGVRGGNGREDRASAQWEARILAALDEERLALYEQPIFGLRSGRALRRELLVRMVEGPDVVAAGDFLGSAERDGLIQRIDSWAVREAIELAARGMAVNVNVAVQSIEPGLLELMEEELGETGADPANVVIELTEAQLMEDEDAGRELAWRLHELGFKVAVDQFGLGEGALSYLRDLGAAYLKINREFVRDLRRDAATRHAIGAIVRPAHPFGIVTVAVGVEDLATLQTLEELGVDQAQGFALGAPAPVGRAEPAAGSATA